MLNEYYPECRTLPAINETFPQFNRPISLLSPLDLSLRAGNIIPITPPTTPSPPRKRQRLMSDENYLWRPHVMETLPLNPIPPLLPPPTLDPATTKFTDNTNNTTRLTQNTTTTDNITNDNESYTYSLTNSKCPMESVTLNIQDPTTTTNDKNNLHNESHNNFEEIPESQRSIHGQQRTTTRQENELLDTIYVDDDTIVLTEDEDENETLVSSQDLSGYVEDIEDEVHGDEEGNDADDGIKAVETVRQAQKRRFEHHIEPSDEENDDNDNDEDEDDEDEDEYVDILSNDDDDLNPLRLQQRQIIEAELEAERSGAVLTRNKLVYDNEELHNQAINGLAKLFERDFASTASDRERRERKDLRMSQAQNEENKTYTNLDSNNEKRSRDTRSNEELHKYDSADIRPTSSVVSRSHKTHKAERKRMKMRKYLGLDEETISPVSGTIIRKLRDDEELVVRKGDIDPAFNVVEITEEAKAILASIDNKIGAYLCQLCRTLYDDAFMLAQHRCPRIVHIEYKCSECEKVFNCPANLASHRRWHKPKSELLANKQNNKRQHVTPSATQSESTGHEKSNDDSVEGIFPCTQCGKTFRRQAYLKKHQASHQMLENLKSLDIFKHHNTSATPFTFPHLHHYTAAQHHHHHNHQTQHNHHSGHHYQPTSTLFGANSRHYVGHYQPTASMLHPVQSVHNHKVTATNPTQLQRLQSSAFNFPPSDQRRFYTLGEIYLSQQLERSSAFQYVQQANHLRNLTTAVGSLLPTPTTPSLASRPLMHPTLMSLAVK